ncbi:response regulator transcription factor [Nitrospira sp. Kam-Ns4a]
MMTEPSRLSRREAEVLSLVVRGRSNSEIGLALHLSARTVQKHLERIYQKLGVRNRTEAAVQAYARRYRRSDLRKRRYG